MTLNKVDLPQPDGPITDKNSPGATVKEILSTAVSTPSGVSNRLTMSSTTRIGIADCWSRALATDRLAIARPISALLVHGTGQRDRHRRGIAGLDPNVDDRDLAVFDRGDRFLINLSEVLGARD